MNAPANSNVLRGGPTAHMSAAGKARLLSVRGEPLFFAGWERALFFHYEIEPAILQRELPFELDLRDGKAFVSLVAFTMRDMKPRLGGRLGAWLFKPISTHSFLNARTYVQHDGESGICFLTEWLSSRLSVALGPPVYGLPYRFAKIDYRHEHETNHLRGEVKAPKRAGQFVYEARLESGNEFFPCEAGSLEEFLLERYTAFNWRGKSRRFFRVWHPPWPQMPAQVSVGYDSLLTATFPWFENARLVGANYSPGFHEVWMGRAHLCKLSRGEVNG
ncbi:MAG TPA: DUF2071 domain-containing protein [Candidatus Aquilonibacter sp.]|nr:DUF2071 domain-containing protein [Candidatus Aquilonibacter sp.]